MIESLREQLQGYLGVSGLSWASMLTQIGLIVILLSWGYIKLVRHSPAEKTVKGILIFLLLIWCCGELCVVLHLRVLAALLKNFILLIVLSAVVIFQPELRRLLALLGNQISLAEFGKKKIDNQPLIQILIQTITYWKKHKTGALLVFENQEPVDVVTTAGVNLNAQLSSELLINIFFVNTPLHDGAVIVKNNRILSAAVILPLAHDTDLSWKYGTRHRAAIGLSNKTDACCLVVSEESGDVSLIHNGKIQTYDNIDELTRALPRFLSILTPKTHNSFFKRLEQILKNYNLTTKK